MLRFGFWVLELDLDRRRMSVARSRGEGYLGPFSWSGWWDGLHWTLYWVMLFRMLDSEAYERYPGALIDFLGRRHKCTPLDDGSHRFNGRIGL